MTTQDEVEPPATTSVIRNRTVAAPEWGFLYAAFLSAVGGLVLIPGTRR